MENQELERSLSSSSSSSFDSCSDLLDTLDLAEKNISDAGNLKDAQHPEISSAVGDNSTLTIDNLSTMPNQTEQSAEGSKWKISPLSLFEIKEDFATASVYGLSTSMTLSMVRSLAENTVDKISSLHSTLRLPSGYIFPSKSVNNTDNTISTDSNVAALVGFSDSCGPPSDEGTHAENVNEGLCRLDDNDTSVLSEDIPPNTKPVNDSHSKLIDLDSLPVKHGHESAEVTPVNDESRDTHLHVSNTENVDNKLAFSEDSKHVEFSTGISINTLHENSNTFQFDRQSLASPASNDDLQKLENSINCFDLQDKSPALSHPLRILISGSGRPDLEDDDEVVKHSEAANRNQPAGWTPPLHNASRICNESAFSRSVPRLIVGDPIVDEALGSHFTQEMFLSKDVFQENLEQEISKEPNIQKDQKPLISSQGLSIGSDELSRYLENMDLNETYLDMILDMENVLLNSDESGNRNRFQISACNSLVGTPRSSRDGSLSSSTSGLFSLGSGDYTPFKIDEVEVIGAKQIKGGSSFGERIVGVKDHTVYFIKVSSGSQEWEVVRRYRDFVDLYHQLRRKFKGRTEITLPLVWKEVDAESRKVFGGTSANVVEVRSNRIERCLQSLIQAGPPFSNCAPLYWFLHPQDTGRLSTSLERQTSMSTKGSDVQLRSFDSPNIQSPRSEMGSTKGELDQDSGVAFPGKTIKLVLKIHPNRNLKQLLSSQHNCCAGCYKPLDLEKGLVNGFVQTLGWGKPRLCEYSGQLYCTSCHLNETAVLPAQVLWNWDFKPRPVSQLAKAYLDSIYDQPMLCVGAVNPFLYSRVPILSHVKDIRRKLSKMLSSMQCPSRFRIQQTMSSRRYLLENNDFFALRDLEDLSKGAFAALPGLLTAVLENIKTHIMKQCSSCQNMGEWCGAGVLCEDPFSPIFPFEEENTRKCKVCQTPFHKTCFAKCSSCPSCTKEYTKKSMEPITSETSFGNHTNTASLSNNEAMVNHSLSSSFKDTTFEEPGITVGQPRKPKQWSSLYGLLPTKRIW